MLKKTSNNYPVIHTGTINMVSPVTAEGRNFFTAPEALALLIMLRNPSTRLREH
jgi:hypothetical protein